MHVTDCLTRGLLGGRATRFLHAKRRGTNPPNTTAVSVLIYVCPVYVCLAGSGIAARAPLTTSSLGCTSRSGTWSKCSSSSITCGEGRGQVLSPDAENTCLTYTDMPGQMIDAHRLLQVAAWCNRWQRLHNSTHAARAMLHDPWPCGHGSYLPYLWPSSVRHMGHVPRSAHAPRGCFVCPPLQLQAPRSHHPPSHVHLGQRRLCMEWHGQCGHVTRHMELRVDQRRCLGPTAGQDRPMGQHA